MLSPSGSPPFTPLANEQTLFTSAPRISLALTTPAHFPGKQQQPFSLSSSSGRIYLSNRRIIFLPDKSTPQFQSFAAPLTSLHDSHVTAPWFGPNVWVALLQPTQSGGIPIPPGGAVELKLTFKEGGAFDFHTKYEVVRERLQQAVDVSRLNGDGDGGSRTAMSGAAAANVHLEDLPAYQEEGDGPLIAPIAPAIPIAATSSVGVQTSTRPSNTPAEPPPGYEEAQLAVQPGDISARPNGG